MILNFILELLAFIEFYILLFEMLWTISIVFFKTNYYNPYLVKGFSLLPLLSVAWKGCCGALKAKNVSNLVLYFI